MRKKLLSLLTVLCLVLGMLPATAMAIDTTSIDKNSENVQVVVEDTALTGTIEKLVLVDAAVKVDVTDAELTVGLVVSPDAEGAEITLSGSTTVAELVVLASASVKVEETASVTAVTIDASDVTVEVAGTVETITVTENATGAELIVAETAEIGGVTDATGELTVSGDGAENVTVEDTSAPAGDEDEAADEDEDSETDDSSSVPDFIPPVDPGASEDPGETAPSVTTGLKISWGSQTTTIQKGEKAAVTLTDVLTADPAAEKAAAAGYWIGFTVKKIESGNYNYTVAVKAAGSEEVAAKTVELTPKSVEQTDGSVFIYFDITELVNTALTEAAAQTPEVTADDDPVTGNGEDEDTEDTDGSGDGDSADDSKEVTANINKNVSITITVTEKADGAEAAAQDDVGTGDDGNDGSNVGGGTGSGGSDEDNTPPVSEEYTVDVTINATVTGTAPEAE